MLIRFLATATGDCVLRRFQLHDYAGEPLSQRIVNVARHPVALSQDGSLATLLGKFMELNCQHRLVGQCLRQFDLLRPIRWAFTVTNADEPFHAAAYQRGYSQELLRSSG